MVSLPQDENEQQQNNEDQTNDSQYKLISRVAAYPTVSAVLESAKGYYETAKERSSFVKKAAENVESNIDSTMKYIVQPVMSNERVSNVLSSVDNMSCKQLDKLEKVAETYTPTVIALKDKAMDMVEQSVQKIEPIDQYLKDSYLAAPFNIAVSTFEKSMDKYLPEEKSTDEKNETEKSEETTTTTSTTSTESSESNYEAGPIFKSGKLALRLQKNALTKLNNLTLRDSTTTSRYLYVVDLIQYAATNLDSGVEATSKMVNNPKENIIDPAKKMISEKAQSTMTQLDSTKVQVENLTHEAVNALMMAIDVLSKRIPEPITSTSAKLMDKSKSFASSLEASNFQLYSAVASMSAEKLRETSALISASMNDPEGLPAHLVQNAKNTLSGILDNLMSRDYSSVTSAVNSFIPVSPSLIKLN